MYKYRFSIFTATYNRCALLPILYESIKNQTFDKSKFEWIIVSDGSTDDTEQTVNQFINEGVINIKFIHKSNGGKHTAWIEATKEFEGRYVVTADDDDPITLDYLSVFDKYWTELESSPMYKEFWEIRARAKYEDGNLVGVQLPLPYYDSDYINVTYVQKKGAEMVGCRKVEVLRNEAKVPSTFPYSDKSSNYPEGIRWAKAAKFYKTRFVPDIIRTYVVSNDSLCHIGRGTQRSIKRNYTSLSNAICRLNEIGNILWKYDQIEFWTTVLQISFSSIRVSEPAIKFIPNRIFKCLVALAYIPSYVLYLFKK